MGSDQSVFAEGKEDNDTTKVQIKNGTSRLLAAKKTPRVPSTTHNGGIGFVFFGILFRVQIIIDY